MSLRFALSSRWLAAHAAVAGAVVVLAALGSWQLTRHAEQRERTATIAERLAGPTTTVEDAAAAIGDDPADLHYLRVEASGRYDVANEVLLRNRSHEGRLGYHVLTPLVSGSGPALLVNRGWVPYEWDRVPVEGALPPLGEVAASGVLLPPEPQPGLLGPRDPPEGRLSVLFNADVDRLALQLPYPVYPVYLLLEQQQPAQSGRFPVAAPFEGPRATGHLSYALQWFGLAVAGLAAYAALLAHRTRRPGG